MITKYKVKMKLFTSEEMEDIARCIVNSGFRVHEQLGPGLMEKVYEICLEYEISKHGYEVRSQVSVPVFYDGIKLHDAFRADLVVADQIIIEIKAVEKDNPVWQAQVISYLKLMDKKLGFLINFNVPLFKNGIKRFIN